MVRGSEGCRGGARDTMDSGAWGVVLFGRISQHYTSSPVGPLYALHGQQLPCAGLQCKAE